MEFECNHEIALYTGKELEKILKEAFDVTDQKPDMILTCGRCSAVFVGNGQYERLPHAMAEIYQGKGLYKRYKVYRQKPDFG